MNNLIYSCLCLTFNVVFQGDIIVVIRRVDSNWCEGRLREQQGIFPVSFVKVPFGFIVGTNTMSSLLYFFLIKISISDYQ